MIIQIQPFSYNEQEIIDGMGLDLLLGNEPGTFLGSNKTNLYDEYGDLNIKNMNAMNTRDLF